VATQRRSAPNPASTPPPTANDYRILETVVFAD
jgi:hypothetical protein